MNKKKRIRHPKKTVKITENSTKAIKRTSTSIVVEQKHKSRANPNSHLKENEETLHSTSFSTNLLKGFQILGPDFYQIDALDLAPRLLGKHLKKDDVILQITEVEAYRADDSACHGRFGITARTAPVSKLNDGRDPEYNVLLQIDPTFFDVDNSILKSQFGPGGHAYVYLCYGLHNMLNVVADKEGTGAAVLIRSCAPVSGLETIQQRRGLISEKPVLLAGPGKVGQALGLSTEWSNHPLFTPGGLELLDGPEPEKILVGPRVGIEYALPEHVDAPWRFAIAGSPWISSPKNTLRPP